VISDVTSWGSRFTEPPLEIEDPAEISWSGVADVVVAGFGAAGACAALEASEHGAKVLVLDRFDGGGATAFSGGIVYSGGGTHVQREAGVVDDPKNMYDYLTIEKPPIADETLLRFCNGSASELKWLAEHGVGFSSAVTREKAGYPPEDKFLYFSGNEAVESFARRAKPAPRGHRVLGTGFTGRDFYAALRGAALKAGVDYRKHSWVTRLVKCRRGEVIGVEVGTLPPEYQDAHQKIYRRVDPMKPFSFKATEQAVVDAHEIEAKYAIRAFIRAKAGVVLV
jgi:3-oxo-5alpha-steroid 4-dehydrogenase